MSQTCFCRENFFLCPGLKFGALKRWKSLIFDLNWNILCVILENCSKALLYAIIWLRKVYPTSPKRLFYHHIKRDRWYAQFGCIIPVNSVIEVVSFDKWSYLESTWPPRQIIFHSFGLKNVNWLVEVLLRLTIRLDEVMRKDSKVVTCSYWVYA